MWKLQEQIDEVENYAYVEQVFTKEQCKKIIELGEALFPKTASTFGGDQKDIRDSKISWIIPSEDSAPIFKQLTDVTNAINSNFFKFDLEGFAEGLQFTKYEAPAGKYDLHIDKTYRAQTRKLSIVIQLSDPDDYEGGELVFKLSGEDTKIKRQQGYLVAFPSYVLHAVTPVTKGTRYSLVAWITGPNFK